MSRDICLLTGIAPDGVQIRRVLWIYFTQTGWIIIGFLMFIWERQIRIRWAMPEGSESEAHWFLTWSSAALPISSRVQVSRIKSAPSSAAILTGSGDCQAKGPSKDQEMEEDSDSEKIQLQVSQNIAKQRLRALAEKRGGRNQAVGHPRPLQRVITVLLFRSQEHPPSVPKRRSTTQKPKLTLSNSQISIPFTRRALVLFIQL